MDRMFEGYSEYEDRNGDQYLLVEMKKNRSLLSWKVIKEGSVSEAICLGVPVENVTVEELKRLELWKQLPKETQEKIKKVGEVQQQEVVERMANVRKGRRKKYNFEGLPEMLTCQCGNTAKANYYALSSKAAEQCIPLHDFIKSYKCRKCKSKKNPDAVHSLTCSKCKQPKGTTPTNFEKQLKKSGKSKKEFMETYICKKCKKALDTN